ncbi:MAG: phosphatase PAP2 family protein [Treponema sp.]|nr:phosphatase PAP2 family protein [Treponema sp.]
MRNKIIAVMVLFITSMPAFSFSSPDYDKAFSLNPINDGIQLSFGALFTGSAIICDNVFHIKSHEYNAADWNVNDLPEIDRFFMQPYSKALHIAGTGAVALAFGTPLIFGVLPPNEWLTIGTMFAETLLISNGFKQWTKLLVYRARPYMYFDGYPQKKFEEGDWNCSFPSGHTTFAFASASFTTMLFCNYFPDSNWKYTVAGVTYGIAVLTGCLRIASGNHFFTDVITGAFIGTVCGLAVPYMHTRDFYSKFDKKSKSTSASVSPLGVNLAFRF